MTSKTVTTMAAGEFKARCLQVMDEVRRTRRPVVITKRGRPVAKLIPAEPEPQAFLGSLRGKIKIVGDIRGPVEPPEAWEIEQEWEELLRENPPR